jgi:hypothetical protein
MQQVVALVTESTVATVHGGGTDSVGIKQHGTPKHIRWLFVAHAMIPYELPLMTGVGLELCQSLSQRISPSTRH